ncbi:MAG: winged helix-turn-helix domain-containing protein, partial [Thermomonas sp.]
DDILDAVWGHRHVTPGVLNRVMTLLRHALGEEASAPRYLHTVHGVGYRFDMPAGATPAPSLAAATPEEPVLPEPVPVEPTLSGTDPVVEAMPMRRASDSARTWPRALVLLPLLAALLVFAGWTLWPRATPSLPPAAVPVGKRSIAVLPLVNASGDKNQQFFSDGLSENLIHTLSRFDGLKVIGPTSSFQFRDSKDDSKAIGTKLGVAYLVSGSVQRAGDTVRIGVALVSTADGSTVWTEHYDRPYQSLFALQDEIGTAVASALQAKLLTTNTASRPDDRPPNGKIDAYNAYLQGLKHWHEEEFPEAARYMALAVQLDPSYAVAWAHLSGSLSTVATFRDEAPTVAREHLRASRLAADTALQLAPGLGSAHAARAYLRFYGFDHQGALAECRRAVQLAPDDGTVLNGCGFTFARIGKVREAIRLRERLISIEPLYVVNYFQYAHLLMATGRLEEAEKYLRIAEGLAQPTPATPYQFLDLAIVRGDMKRAQRVARNQPSQWRERNLALVAQMSPDLAAADAALDKLVADKAWANTHAYYVARAYALHGDRDKTLEWLERTPPHALLVMLTDPLILRFRDDPRLAAFFRKIGLPPPDTTEALSIDQIQAGQARDR